MLTDDDTVATLTPLAALADQTRYTLRVRGVLDRVGKMMAADYVATFTTVDVKPPDRSRRRARLWAREACRSTRTIRLTFSETARHHAIHRARRFRFTGPAGAVAGRIDYLVGNTVVVFTPNCPAGRRMRHTACWSMQRASDLAGNSQPPGARSIQFTHHRPHAAPGRLGSPRRTAATVVENGSRPSRRCSGVAPRRRRRRLLRQRRASNAVAARTFDR